MATVKEQVTKTKERKLFGCIPVYSILPVILLYATHAAVYELTLWINSISTMQKFDLTTAFDRLVPFLSEWILIYLLSYGIWLFGFFVIANLGRKDFYRFLTACFLAIILGGIIFVVFPTTIQLPEVTGTRVFDSFVKFIYSADKPYNLFPSFHCFTSWIIFIGMREKKGFSWWYKGSFLILAILVFLSTQFVKQHYYLDIIGGIALAEIAWWTIRFTKLPNHVEKGFTKLNYLFWLEKRPQVLEKSPVSKTSKKEDK